MSKILSKRSCLAAIGLGIAVVLSGCDGLGGGDEGGSSASKRLVLLTNGNSPFWDACRKGLEKAEEDFGLAVAGYAAVMEVNDGTPQGQLDKLRQFGSQSDIVGVAVSALDANNAAVADELRNLQKKGVQVVTVDSDVDRERFRDARSYYMGTDNLQGGRELGRAAKQILAAREVSEGSYVQFVGRTGAQNAIERMGGFNETVGEGFKEADRMGDDLDRTRAKENVRNAIRNHKDLVALVGIWSYNAPAIVDIVWEQNKRDELAVVVFDAEPIAIKQLGEGMIDAMVVQNPFKMGYEAVRVLKAMIGDDQETLKKLFPNPEATDGDLLDTGLKVVVPENSPIKPEGFGQKTEFLELPKFKAWLDEYHLTGS